MSRFVYIPDQIKLLQLMMKITCVVTDLVTLITNVFSHEKNALIIIVFLVNSKYISLTNIILK